MRYIRPYYRFLSEKIEMDSTYIVDNNIRNGNFTEGMEYTDFNSVDTSRLKYWSGENGSGVPPANHSKWLLDASALQVWPGTDGTESVTLGNDWYCEGVLPFCGQP